MTLRGMSRIYFRSQQISMQFVVPITMQPPSSIFSSGEKEITDRAERLERA